MISRSKKLKALFAVIAVVGIVLVVYVVALMRQSELPAGLATGNGRTEATDVDITTKFGGRLERVLANQLRRAEADVRRIRQEREVAMAVIAQRDSELSLAEKDMQRSIGLYENDSISLEQLERDETAVETARATLTAARAQLSNAEAAIEAAIANTELIKTQIDDSVLRSPIRGRVLYRLAEPGEVIPAGGKVLTVVDPTDMYMTLFLPTQIAARVGIGAEARVVFDGLADQVIPALDSEFLYTHTALAKAGIPGVAYIRIDPNAEWPEHLRTADDGSQP
jgi:HlyD family secretion protein